METTLGKRISAARKKLGLTQDQLAERLGVTAQAVSKWENDQSCPDIAMLPKLAEIFGMSTDALLGMEKERVCEAEVVEAEEPRPKGLHFENGSVEFNYDGGHRGSFGFALWVLLTGVLMTFDFLHNGTLDMWNAAWPAGLLIFGLVGMYPRFSFFRLGFALIGGYFVLELHFVSLPYENGLLVPVLLVLFGLSLLADAIRKPRKFHCSIPEISRKAAASYACQDDRFDCGLSFGEARQRVDNPCLKGGRAEVSFGELTVDLSGCAAFAPDCRINLDCSFGQLNLLVPKTCRVREIRNTSFAAVEVNGSPVPDANAELIADCNVSFGEIQIQYI